MREMRVWLNELQALTYSLYCPAPLVRDLHPIHEHTFQLQTQNSRPLSALEIPLIWDLAIKLNQ